MNTSTHIHVKIHRLGISDTRWNNGARIQACMRACTHTFARARAHTHTPRAHKHKHARARALSLSLFHSLSLHLTRLHTLTHHAHVQT